MKTTLVAVEDGAFLTLPDNMLERLALKEGDVVEAVELPNGALQIKRAEPAG